MTCWCACTVRARQMSASGRRPPGGGVGVFLDCPSICAEPPNVRGQVCDQATKRNDKRGHIGWVDGSL